MAVAAVIMACVRPSASFCVALRPLAAASALGGKSQERTTRIVMQQAENSWNFGRFAKTFGFFNGNPLLKLIPFAPSGEPSVKQPDPVVSGNELVLWNFQGMDKVCIRGVCMHACLRVQTNADGPACILTVRHLRQREFENMWAPLDDVVMGGVSVRYM